MPLALEWLPQADALILHLRAEGVSWTDISRQLGVGRNAAIARARVLGLEPNHKLPSPLPVIVERRDRPPLPAGHPIAWAAINHDTLLQGVSYPFPVFT